MEAVVSSLRTFPLKGAQAWRTLALEVNTKVGVVNDRRFAIRKTPGDITMRADQFNKLDFHVCANNPKMAMQLPELFIIDGFKPDPQGLVHIAKRIGAQFPLQVQDTGGEYHLCDTGGPKVSFLNLATVIELAKVMRVAIDPDRFRMNIWIKGLPAFAEYDWVDMYPGTRKLMVGDVRFQIDDACERCRAPEANPRTGEYDLRIAKGLRELMGPRGYVSPHRGVQTVMGVYGTVLNEGVIEPRDKIQLL